MNYALLPIGYGLCGSSHEPVARAGAPTSFSRCDSKHPVSTVDDSCDTSLSRRGYCLDLSSSPLDRDLAVSEAARAHICRSAKKFCNIFTGSKPSCMRANAWACDVHLATWSTHAAWGLDDAYGGAGSCTGHPFSLHVSLTLLCTLHSRYVTQDF